MRLSGTKIIVGTTPTVVFAFVPSQFNSVAFQATAGIEIGVGGVVVGEGFPIAAGGSFGFNREDIDTSSTDLVRIYAVASAPTNVRVLHFSR